VPVIVFRAEVEIALHNGNLCTDNAKTDHHYDQEAEHVIYLTQPNGGHEIHCLHEYGAEWEQSAGENVGQGLNKEWGLSNSALKVSRLNDRCDRVLGEANVRAQGHERGRHAEPQGDHSKESDERDGG